VLSKATCMPTGSYRQTELECNVYLDRGVGNFVSKSVVATNFADIVIKTVLILQKLVRIFIGLLAAFQPQFNPNCMHTTG